LQVWLLCHKQFHSSSIATSHMSFAACTALLLLQVRLLCRKQFLARALGLKVAAAQRQQPQQRSSGSQGAACTLTHGDTWSHR
jgi:hypothetical protein